MKTQKGFSIIVATDAERGIGEGNKIPWHLSRDMRHFKEITTRPYTAGFPNVVLMGRRTWESLPEAYRPLPGRLNVVLTSDVGYALPSGVEWFGNFADAINFFCNIRKEDFGEIFVIGGASLYVEAIKHPLCYKIYNTFIQQIFFCDKFFPEIPHYFKECSRSPVFQEKELTFFFAEFISQHFD